ncbi:MAG: hypothetical protein LBI87_03430 [Candidatus Accumulibacter sp.]|jgi:hypothetical protein|nr:hypothetical protein [Accumulibacter sp.]
MSGNGNEAGKPTGDTARLTDIVGSRSVTVKAEMTIDGTRYSARTTVAFGDGPLSVFKGAPLAASYDWADAAAVCGGAGDPNAAAGYQPATRLPTREQLAHVSGPGGITGFGKQGAALAAGWLRTLYWTGVMTSIPGYPETVSLPEGAATMNADAELNRVVCLP